MRDKPIHITYTRSELVKFLSSALADEKKIVNKCYAAPLKKIEKDIRQMNEELSVLMGNESIDLEEHNETVKILINELYAEYRKTLMNLVYESSSPFNADDYITDEQAEYNTITEIDQKVEGVFVYIEPRRIMLRIPPLPHRNKPEVWIDAGKRGQFRKTQTDIYRDEVRRALDMNPDYRRLDYFAFTEKTVQYLNVFGEDMSHVMDNDNRDMTAVTNSICAYLPGGDSAVNCSFFLDGLCTEQLPAGTYITVQPRSCGIMSRDDIVAYWTSKLFNAIA